MTTAKPRLRGGAELLVLTEYGQKTGRWYACCYSSYSSQSSSQHNVRERSRGEELSVFGAVKQSHGFMSRKQPWTNCRPRNILQKAMIFIVACCVVSSPQWIRWSLTQFSISSLVWSLRKECVAGDHLVSLPILSGGNCVISMQPASRQKKRILAKFLPSVG